MDKQVSIYAITEVQLTTAKWWVKQSDREWSTEPSEF